MEQHLHHDLELIAAYAEGLLADGDEARRLVDECSECRGEYDMQRSVKGLLGGLPPARLTDEQRSQLHAVIDHVARGKVVTLADRRRAQRWMRATSVAAAALVLVGIGTVFIGALGSGSRGADTTTAGASLDASGAEESIESTTQAATALGESYPYERYRLMSGGDEDAVREEIASMLEGSPTASAEGPLRADLCLDELSDREMLDVAQSRLDGRPIIIVIVAAEDGKEAVVYDEATCRVVEIPPE